MKYEWDQTLLTGNATIDNQHKQLFAAVNNFHEACMHGKGKEEIQHTLNFLITYTAEHFRDEENLQIQYDFPDYLRHRQYHRDFTKTVLGLAEKLLQEGPSVALTDEVYQTVGDWLLHHIKSDDFVLAAFITAQNSPARDILPQ